MKPHWLNSAGMPASLAKSEASFQMVNSFAAKLGRNQTVGDWTVDQVVLVLSRSRGDEYRCFNFVAIQGAAQAWRHGIGELPHRQVDRRQAQAVDVLHDFFRVVLNADQQSQAEGLVGWFRRGEGLAGQARRCRCCCDSQKSSSSVRLHRGLPGAFSLVMRRFRQCDDGRTGSGKGNDALPAAHGGCLAVPPRPSAFRRDFGTSQRHPAFAFQ